MRHHSPEDHGGHGGHGGRGGQDRPGGQDERGGPGGHAGQGRGAGGVDHAGHEALFRRRFFVCLALSLPVLLYSPMLQEMLGFSAPSLPGSGWIAPALGTVIFIYGGLPFLRMAVPELRAREPGMMTLISLAIVVAFAYSLWTVIAGTDGDFFWELVTLIVIMLLGHWLEMRSVRQASGALDELAALLPDTAERIAADGELRELPVAELAEGDLVLVRPGARVPVDAEVVEGSSDVDESILTGESRPVAKAPGDRITGGTTNGDGSLRARVAAVGEDTALAGIMRLVAEAQRSRSGAQLMADRAAGLLFYVALLAATLTAVGWLWATGDAGATVQRVVTVLVIACPHALGLAVPLVVSISTALGARNGILVRDRRALESASGLDVVVFDKTGTLTQGQHGLRDLAVAPGWEADEALALAAGLEADSEHPLARALVQAAEERGLEAEAVRGFEAEKGRGVRAVRADGTALAMGGPRWLADRGLSVPDALASFAEAAGARGETVVYLAVGDALAAAFGLADVVRPESAPAIARLHDMGIETVMLTGDSEDVARSVAAEVGLDRVVAGVLPERKSAAIGEIKQAGQTVAMVGDGVNDAPALAAADVGVAIGGGTDVAIDAAGIVLVDSDPGDVPSLVLLSRATRRKMTQNLWWAAGYNLVAIPLAAGLLAPWGILLSPAVGALAMSLSTVIVALNAQLLRRVDLREGGAGGRPPAPPVLP